ncbi:acyl-CoA thioesterase [Actinomyces sp. 2119]|uniref:Acyl-CoA thioesterase n=1 Tax=Actinomyces lilanjuaniae TaxID=2321394 RepID=A0ABM6Z1A1_9ACTO|nr:acyl-CoA thioesterase [Actinomyces sp. 2119]AYD88890.1 acyl-CoA thioesterase [Actinomyces lilanjuaniae]RJF43803.1 acyl-CoA thioesterase [Actinomyces sp. 2119]
MSNSIAEETRAAKTGDPDPVEVALRWSDVDQYGHINNCAIMRLLEEARLRWLHRSGYFKDIAAVVASHQVTYLRPLYYSEEPALVTVAPILVRRGSFDLRHVIRDAGESEVARATTRLVLIDLETQRPQSLPDGLSSFLGSRI